MFGYITINQEELKVREAKDYKAYYCGLCHMLHQRHGRFGQLTLTYDMTFLAVLLSALYETPMEVQEKRCLLHPFSRHRMCIGEYAAYAADMNVLLSYYNLLDDWQDDRKIGGYLTAKALLRHCKKVQRAYPRQYQAVLQYLGDLSKCETERYENIEWAACLTGRLLAEIFVRDEDEWSADLRQMGFFLGKFIYLMDAYEDIDDDIQCGSYNPLTSIRNCEDFETECQNILMMQMAECCRAFERLPIVTDVAILRNILYSGVWSRFATICHKKEEKPTKKNI